MDYTSKYRAWHFTLNNYTLLDEEHIKTTVKSLARYIVYGYEVGEKCRTPHLQGYVYFHNQRQQKAVARLLPRAHIEPARKSAQEGKKYCQKQGNGGWEWGDMPIDPSVARERGGQGNAARYAKAIEHGRAGRADLVREEDPQLYLLHGVRIESLYAPDTVPIDGELLHEWWVGPSGSGKSRLLWELYPNHFAKALNKWWDGYRFQDVVAIEEWAPKNDCTASALKKWADRYPFPGEIKGGNMQRLRPKKIIVLSNYTPQQCFLNSEDLEPMLRRFTVINFPQQEQHARFRAADFVDATPLETPIEVAEEPEDELPLPDLSLDGDFFLDV